MLVVVLAHLLAARPFAAEHAWKGPVRALLIVDSLGCVLLAAFVSAQDVAAASSAESAAVVSAAILDGSLAVFSALSATFFVLVVAFAYSMYTGTRLDWMEELRRRARARQAGDSPRAKAGVSAAETNPLVLQRGVESVPRYRKRQVLRLASTLRGGGGSGEPEGPSPPPRYARRLALPLSGLPRLGEDADGGAESASGAESDYVPGEGGGSSSIGRRDDSAATPRGPLAQARLTQLRAYASATPRARVAPQHPQQHGHRRGDSEAPPPQQQLPAPRSVMLGFARSSRITPRGRPPPSRTPRAGAPSPRSARGAHLARARDGSCGGGGGGDPPGRWEQQQQQQHC